MCSSDLFPSHDTIPNTQFQQVADFYLKHPVHRDCVVAITTDSITVDMRRFIVDWRWHRYKFVADGADTRVYIELKSIETVSPSGVFVNAPSDDIKRTLDTAYGRG